MIYAIGLAIAFVVGLVIAFFDPIVAAAYGALVIIGCIFIFLALVGIVNAACGAFFGGREKP